MNITQEVKGFTVGSLQSKESLLVSIEFSKIILSVG